MSLQDIYTEMESGLWAVPEEGLCPCHGGGWVLSDLDTWHKCPIHFHGQRHPEDEGPAELTAAERATLRALATRCPNEEGDRLGTLGWNACEILRSLADLGLVEYREIPRRDGALLARITERGMKSYRKGLRLGVYDPR
jgi:hypothetical protein